MSYSKSILKPMKINKLIFFMGILILLLISVTISAKVKAASNDFTIENGVLIKYHGNNEKVTIPDTVTSIGEFAFIGCESLTSITMSDQVTSIGKYAFSGCIRLTSIHIPATVTDFGDLAFKNTPWLKAEQNENPFVIINDILIDATTCKGNVTIPDTVKCIGKSAFFKCASLTGVIIPESVIKIGEHAFLECKNLTSITIPDSVTSIELGAFSVCSSLLNITMPNSITSIEREAFWACSKLNSIIIPNSVISIGEAAFLGCNSLKSITIPNSVTNIGDKAFSDCSTLTNIKIPDSVTSIGPYAFNNTSWIVAKRKESPLIIVNHIVIDASTCAGKVIIPKGVTEIGELAFYKSTVTEVVIPEGVTKIGTSALSTGSLVKVTLPGGLIEIMDGAFSGTLISGVIIPDSVTLIGEKAFYRCSRLQTIQIPEGVKSIGDSAFAVCEKLVSITLPKSVEYIGKDVFLNNISLTDIQVNTENPNYFAEDNLLYNKDKTVLLGCSNAVGEIVIPEGTQKIMEGIFIGSGITKITFPSTLKILGDNEFTDCKYLEEIVLPSSLVSFGIQTFGYHSILKNINVFETKGDKNYASVNGVLYNGDKSMLFCDPEAGDIIVPDTVTAIGSYAFPNVRNSITIPNSVKSFGENIFVNEVNEWTPANEEPLLIYGYAGSEIEEYCENTQWGVRFLALDGTYTITYNTKGGINNSSNPKTFTKDTETIVLKSPTLNGYTFQYWYIDYSICNDGCCRGEREVKEIQKGTLGDIILNAKWVKVEAGQANISYAYVSAASEVSIRIQPVTGAIGYQIVIAKNSKFTVGKEVISIRITDTVMRNLDMESTYYIKVRAYKIDSAGERIYGGFSKVKVVNFSGK